MRGTSRSFRPALGSTRCAASCATPAECIAASRFSRSSPAFLATSALERCALRLILSCVIGTERRVASLTHVAHLERITSVWYPLVNPELQQRIKDMKHLLSGVAIVAALAIAGRTGLGTAYGAGPGRSHRNRPGRHPPGGARSLLASLQCAKPLGVRAPARAIPGQPGQPPAAGQPPSYAPGQGRHHRRIRRRTGMRAPTMAT